MILVLFLLLPPKSNTELDPASKATLAIYYSKLGHAWKIFCSVGTLSMPVSRIFLLGDTLLVYQTY